MIMTAAGIRFHILVAGGRLALIIQEPAVQHPQPRPQCVFALHPLGNWSNCCVKVDRVRERKVKVGRAYLIHKHQSQLTVMEWRQWANSDHQRGRGQVIDKLEGWSVGRFTVSSLLKRWRTNERMRLNSSELSSWRLSISASGGKRIKTDIKWIPFRSNAMAFCQTNPFNCCAISFALPLCPSLTSWQGKGRCLAVGWFGMIKKRIWEEEEGKRGKGRWATYLYSIQSRVHSWGVGLIHLLYLAAAGIIRKERDRLICERQALN